jgi:hypothetical protein
MKFEDQKRTQLKNKEVNADQEDEENLQKKRTRKKSEERERKTVEQ